MANDSGKGLSDLAAKNCDLAMASRKIKKEEAAGLKDLGDMEDARSEKVIGYDGIAVVVNRNNGVDKLSKDQIHKIFSGEISDWKDLPNGKSGKIKVYAREQGSGTLDFFVGAMNLKDEKDSKKDKIISTAERISDSNELSKKVSADDNAIGFIGLPYVKEAKAVAVSDGDSDALLPTAFTIATRDYLLSRELYLYVPTTFPANTDKNFLTKFTEFVLGKDGRKIVADQKFVSLDVIAKKDKDSNVAEDNAPDAYKKMTVGATRSNVNIRFRSGSTRLDNASLQRIDIILESLVPGQRVLLIGFTDNLGGTESNLKFSRDRANAVADAFRQRGVTVETTDGFGAARPVASNDTEDGREKNRRVEVWIKTS